MTESDSQAADLPKDVQLRVADARQRDVGHSKVRINKGTMQKLAITPGGFVEVHGKKMTVARAWPAYSEDQGEEIVRMDGLIRRNAGLALNEYVVLKKADMKDAQAITFAPTEATLSIDEEFVSFVKRRFTDLPFVDGDIALLSIFGSAVALVITRTIPHGPVKIVENSHVRVLTEAMADKKHVPMITYEEIGDLREQTLGIRDTAEVSFRPEVFQKLGIEPPRGILVYGPPGCGKTLLAKAVANEFDADFFTFQGGGISSGETEAKLRELFQEALSAPSVILIHDIDRVAPQHLLTMMESIDSSASVVVIGTADELARVDQSLRRPGMFEKTIEFPLPDIQGRLDILRIHTRRMPLAQDVDLKHLADLTDGFAGAQLALLCKEAAVKAFARCKREIDLEEQRVPPEAIDKVIVSMVDFVAALPVKCCLR